MQSFLILIFSLFLSIGVYLWVVSTSSSQLTQIIKLQQIFALTALAFLYLSLITTHFKKFSKYQPSLVVSTFYFGLLHGLISFFGQLGGFEGLGFLSNKYLLAITLSFSGLLILMFLSVISFKWILNRLQFLKSRFLKFLIYFSGILILTHALMLGSHFQDLSGLIPQILLVALFILLIFEALRIDNFLQQKFSFIPRFGLVFILVAGIIITNLCNAFISADSPLSLGIHAAHIQLAKEAQQNNSNPLPNIPGLIGDRTKRFTVDFDYPQNIKPNQEVELKIKVYNASSGNKINLFQTVYEKPMHLIIVDKSLNYFNHIHPIQTGEGFIIKTSFPKDGLYHLYTDFQPLGAIEQQFAFSLPVGKNTDSQIEESQPNSNLTKTFGDYEITLDYPKPLSASKLSIGQQELRFTVKEAKTTQPITNLKPYLASFGHLVMINQKTFDYLHVHPTNLVAPKPDENGGPEVKFLPIGIYSPIKPGIYKIFAQFNPDNKLITGDFIVEVR